MGRVGLLTAAFVLITTTLGWWGVAAIGVLWGWIARSDVRHPVLLAGCAAGLAWLATLGWTARVGESGPLLQSLSSVMAIPEWAIVAGTLGIGIALGASGAWLGTVFTRRATAPETPTTIVS